MHGDLSVKTQVKNCARGSVKTELKSKSTHGDRSIKTKVKNYVCLFVCHHICQSDTSPGHFPNLSSYQGHSMNYWDGGQTANSAPNPRGCQDQEINVMQNPLTWKIWNKLVRCLIFPKVGCAVTSPSLLLLCCDVILPKSSHLTLSNGQVGCVVTSPSLLLLCCDVILPNSSQLTLSNGQVGFTVTSPSLLLLCCDVILPKSSQLTLSN